MKYDERKNKCYKDVKVLNEKGKFKKVKVEVIVKFNEKKPWFCGQKSKKSEKKEDKR
jgi:hypothetical protein